MIMKHKLENFKGRKHDFTNAERRKGGSNKSEKKQLAAKTNAITTSKHVKDTKFCSTCLLHQFCPEYNPDPEQRCTVINHKNFKKIMHIKGFKTTEEYDYFVFDIMQDLSRAAKDDQESFSILFARLNEILDLKNELL